MTPFRRAAFAVLSLAAVIGMAGAAHGQIAPSRSGSSSLQFMDRSESMRTLVLFGRCYARRARADSLSLIATRPTSREEAEIYRRLFRRDVICLGPGTSMSAPLAYVRGVIAEGFAYVEEGIPASHLLAAPTVDQVRNVSDAARCYAAGHRGEVRALIAIRPGTREEFDAVSAMMAGIRACLPAGARFEIDATVIRYRLVEGLLRLAPAAPARPGN
ncbi:MAG: hypothetical protein QOD42_3327 [Sphingomonadales bacterium]|jgi:hypothetical protein|nr:hypothetical protein [Sphingomonadales bacterium]